jgi:hypothetical protein
MKEKKELDIVRDDVNMALCDLNKSLLQLGALYETCSDNVASKKGSVIGYWSSHCSASHFFSHSSACSAVSEGLGHVGYVAQYGGRCVQYCGWG